jgi:endonuclease YncB( thermonuclease family)
MTSFVSRAPILILVLITFILIGSSAPDEAIGRVVTVVSGDSFGIEIKVADPRANQIDSVRLADIESPSTVYPEGKTAKKFAVSLLKNKTVFLDIDDNATGGRNEFNQLVCVAYLMDNQSRPVWPSVNRILVDSGYATLKDDLNNEFNSTTWWQEPVFPKKDFRSVLIDQSKKTINDAAVIEKDANSSLISIGYRRSM